MEIFKAGRKVLSIFPHMAEYNLSWPIFPVYISKVSLWKRKKSLILLNELIVGYVDK